MGQLQVSTPKAIGIFILAALFLCYEMAVQVSPSVMTHFLMRDLHLSAVELGFMSGFYFYSYTLMQIPAGLLFDRYQVRWVVIVPLAMCAIGAVVFSSATSIVGGSMGRLLMGSGSAFAFISVLVVASDLFHERHFALLAGLTQMLAAFGAMMGEGPLLPLINHHGWRYTMVCLAMTSVVLMFFILIFVRYEKCDRFKQCEAGSGNDIIASFLKIAKNKQTWFVAIYACCLWAPMAAFASLWGVPYLQNVYGLGHTQATELVTMMWVGIAVSSPLLGFISDRIKSRRLPLTAAALMGLVSLVVLNQAYVLPLFVLAILLFFAGAACGGQALSFAVVNDNMDSGNNAAAIGFNNMAVVIAGAIFQPTVGYFVSDQSTLQFQHGINVLIVCYAVGALVALKLIRSRKYG